ncbi:hypothetical protein BJY52DRAFT_330300 [Lactarius psammicola]|nr:hypothetical protein BJY52DRAFT_330300 [Lactarius psammicola]
MPSLRRALSTPSVRVSPYPSLLTSRSQRPHPHGHRRSSGSDLSTRKVLADIDWWRVAHGQREKNEEEEGGEGEGEEDDEGTGEEATGVSVVDTPVVARLVAADHSENASIGIERPSTPDVGVRIFGLEYNSPQSHVSERLATTPRTPTRRTVSESSASSLESTPEVPRTPPLERLTFADMGFADPGPGIPLFHIRLASLGALPPIVPKYVAPEIGDLDKDPILADSLSCHDDLFA